VRLNNAFRGRGVSNRRAACGSFPSSPRPRKSVTPSGSERISLAFRRNCDHPPAARTKTNREPLPTPV